MTVRERFFDLPHPSRVALARAARGMRAKSIFLCCVFFGFVRRRGGLVLGSFLMANRIGGVASGDFWVRFVIFFF